MLQTPQSYDTFERILNTYLSNTRLSLSQVAQKLDISKGHLSELKNKKKKPTLDKGIRILKFCGAQIEDIRAWIDEYHTEECADYAELVSYNKEKLEKHKIKTKIARRMATNLNLLHLYIDVLNEPATGLSVEYIKRNYGEAGLREIQYLVNGDLVTQQENNFFPADAQNYSVIDIENSYDLMKSVFDSQKDEYLSQGIKERCFQFTIEDVSEKGKEELRMAFENYMKEVHKITKEHALPVTQGGSRYIVQAMSSLMKTALILLLTLIGATNLQAAGGVGGGDMGIKSYEFLTGTHNFYISDMLLKENTNQEYVELSIQYNRPRLFLGQGDPETDMFKTQFSTKIFDLANLEYLKMLTPKRITGAWRRRRLANEMFQLKVLENFEKDLSTREIRSCRYFRQQCTENEPPKVHKMRVNRLEIIPRQ